MEQTDSTPSPTWRRHVNKLKHPSQFSKPQLAIFVLAFGLIGYILVRTFAAAPVVATLEGEQMTPQLAVAPASGTNSQLSQAPSAQIVLAKHTKFSNLSLPTISGSTTIGSTLTATSGSWNPTASSYLYAWQRCNGSGSSCSQSPTSTNSTIYVIQSGDAGHTFRIQVAPNGDWSSSKDSAPTAIVTAPTSGGFTNTALPTISGSTVVGSTLTAANGVWSPNPTNYGYAWQICDTSGNNCNRSSTSVVTSYTYTLQASDAGHTVRVQVAPNNNFNYSVDSQPTAIVSSPSSGGFTNTALPALSGSSTVGSTLTVTNGGWTPTPTSYSYAWQLCNPNTGSCSLSSTTTNQNTYVIQPGDIGHTIVAQVAPNGQWASAKNSNLSAVVTNASINFSVVNDPTASGGKAAKFGGGVQISGIVNLPTPASSFTVSARDDGCGSDWPYMQVTIDGTTYLPRTAVNSASWNGYSASASLAAGNHTLSITDLDNSSSPCNLYIDDTNFFGQTTPAPTVSLSASPNSITSGQSSTLTWSSTNATSCTASGAWSGTEATSGSQSVSPTASSTYTLTCTGSGGSTSASTTVTVTSTPPSGSVTFDGRASQMTSLTGGGAQGGTQTPNVWTCLCFINHDISLSSDSTYGKAYNMNVATGDSNGFGGTDSTYGAGQLSIRENNDLGKTDYYGMAVKVNSWNGPMTDLFFSDIASLGYQTSSNDQVALGLWGNENNSDSLSYSIAVNGGLSNGGPQGNARGTTNFHETFMPVTYGQWRDFVIAVTWSTNTTGEVKIYSRLPGGSWSVVYDKPNIDTYLYGPVGGAGSFAQNGSNWPTIINKIGLYFKEYGGESESTQESGLTISTSLSAAESTLP